MWITGEAGVHAGNDCLWPSVQAANKVVYIGLGD